MSSALVLPGNHGICQLCGPYRSDSRSSPSAIRFNIGRQAAQQFQASVHDGFQVLARREEIDAILFLSANFYGALPVYAACESGKAIYCAAAIDLQDGEAAKLRQHVEDAGIAFMAEFPCRLSPRYTAVEELLATRLGAPQLLFCNRRRVHPQKAGTAAAVIAIWLSWSIGVATLSKPT